MSPHTLNRKLRRLKRNEKIRASYRKFAAVKEFGVQKHNHEWIMNKLADLYDLAPTTIDKIITNSTPNTTDNEKAIITQPSTPPGLLEG